MCNLWSLALAKRSCNKINNSRAQVSWLCYFLWLCSEAATRGVSCKKVFLEISQNFFKKETLAQVFSWEFCEISKNTFFTEHLWTTASRHIELKNLFWSAKWQAQSCYKYITSLGKLAYSMAEKFSTLFQAMLCTYKKKLRRAWYFSDLQCLCSNQINLFAFYTLHETIRSFYLL